MRFRRADMQGRTEPPQINMNSADVRALSLCLQIAYNIPTAAIPAAADACGIRSVASVTAAMLAISAVTSMGNV
jgi:hypothetical protein